MRDDKVRPVALGYIEYLRSDLDPRGRHGESPQLEPLSLLQFLDDWQRFTAGGVVVEDVGDLLALQVAGQLVLDKLDGAGALRPIGRGDREQVGVARPVRRGRDSEAGRGRRYLVLFQPLIE